MSVPNEPIIPPPPAPPLERPDPDRIPGEEPPPTPEPDQGVVSASAAVTHCVTWGLLCSGVRL